VTDEGLSLADAAFAGFRSDRFARIGIEGYLAILPAFAWLQGRKEVLPSLGLSPGGEGANLLGMPGAPLSFTAVALGLAAYVALVTVLVSLRGRARRRAAAGQAVELRNEVAIASQASAVVSLVAGVLALGSLAWLGYEVSAHFAR
jgi:hypothetical protein